MGSLPQKVEVNQRLEINMAVLDVVSVDVDSTPIVQVYLEQGENSKTLIASLTNIYPQAMLSVKVTGVFYLSTYCTSIVHVSGWISDEQAPTKSISLSDLKVIRNKRNRERTSNSSSSSSSDDSTATTSSSGNYSLKIHELNKYTT